MMAKLPRWALMVWSVAVVLLVALLVALLLTTGSVPERLALIAVGAAAAEARAARRSRRSSRAELEQLADADRDGDLRAEVEAKLADAGDVDEVPLDELVDQEQERGRG